MKTLCKTSILIVLTVAALYSCSKKSDVHPTTGTPPITVDGYWYGTYVTATKSSNLGVLFRQNGTFKIYDFANETSQSDTTQSDNGTGQYTVSHDTLNFAINVPAGYNFNGSGIGIIKTVSPETISINIDNGSIVLSQLSKP